MRYLKPTRIIWSRQQPGPDELADAGVLLQGMDARYMVEQTLYQLLLQADDFAEIELEQLTRLLTLTRDAIQRMEACKRIAGPSPAFVLSSQTPLYFAQSESNCQYLPLPLYHGTEGRLGIHVSFLFINPYSQHPEEALAYLEAYQANLSPESRKRIVRGCKQPPGTALLRENRESCLERSALSGSDHSDSGESRPARPGDSAHRTTN